MIRSRERDGGVVVRVGPTNNGDLRKEEDGHVGHVGLVCQEGYHVTSVTQLAGVARLAEYLSVPA